MTSEQYTFRAERYAINLVSRWRPHRLTLIKGLPGAGKTVLLRDLVHEWAADGTTLFLTANRLSGRSWSEHARVMGSAATSIEQLLVEVSATGHSMVLIDGLDRIAPEQRAIVTDLLGQLLTNPALSDWRVVATARDAGIEPLRNWVPRALLASGGLGYVGVANLTDQEASALADLLPALRPLLTRANERVRTRARRPFFAAVLARGFSQAAYIAYDGKIGWL